MIAWIEEAAALIAAKGGRAYYVGGCVRDMVLGRTPKDYDVEVFGLSSNSLAHWLKRFGKVSFAGKSFGILKLRGADFSVPRRETKRAGKNPYTAYEITEDPKMSRVDALLRRDFTMNAMLQDVLTGEVFDPFGGLKDIHERVVRHVEDAAFLAGNPLQVYRAAQLSARLGFSVAPETIALCRRLDPTGLAEERVYREWLKLLLFSDQPSQGLRVLRDTGVIGRDYPLLAALIGRQHAPSGDAWEHALRALDKAAARRIAAEDPEPFMWRSLLHAIEKGLGLPRGRRLADGFTKEAILAILQEKPEAESS